MTNKPNIKTALPVRRYQLGEFTVVILDQVESGDAVDYRYVLAVVREGEGEPGLYLTAEASDAAGRDEGAYAMRIIMEDGDRVIGVADEWGVLDAFVDEGLSVVTKVLNLDDEEPYRLS